MTSCDPRERLLRAVAAQLQVGPLARRRILAELAHHIDDAADDLSGLGVPRAQAVAQAVKRLGDAETIASAFRAVRTQAGWPRLRLRHSLAWVAALAMSAVTAWAAELPQASGAKPPAKLYAPASRRLSPSDHPSVRHSVGRASTKARPPHGRDRRSGL